MSPTQPPRAELVATLTSPPAPDGSSLAALSSPPLQADWLEIRADLLLAQGAEVPSPQWLRQHTPARLLYTLRSRSEGGADEGSPDERRQLLVAAGETGLDAAQGDSATRDPQSSWDAIDLEAERDLSGAVLTAVDAPRRVLSWHGAADQPVPDLASLRQRFDAMERVPATLYKLIPAARRAGQELIPLLLLRQLQRRDVTAFATGAIASWTRLLTPRLGAPWVYCAATAAAAPGQLSLRRLVEDFGLPQLPPVEALFGLAGDPVHHSLSPRLHNAAYRALGLPYLYLPFAVPHYGDFWLEVAESQALKQLGFPLRGLSVTSPHKAVALAVSGALSPLADAIGGANTLVRRERVWEAESTDPAGVILPLLRRGLDLRGRPVAVVGCGGAGRAAAVGLAHSGAEVTLVNRSTSRGQEVAGKLQLPFVALADFEPEPFDVVVHATHLGHGAEDPLPFEVESMGAGSAVVDMVYRQQATPLIQQARRRSLTAVDGREVLLFQAVDQFRLMTGTALPPELIQHLGREVLRLEEEDDLLGSPSA
ncbi:MAG: type I 3-dehydroquinate dehydratase [Acidobacteriota bacterium]